MMLAIGRNKDPKASAPYLSLLKLSHSPFSTVTGEAGFYADPSRAQQLDMLQHLAQYGDELLLVSGGAGSGKTTMLERFLERGEEHWRTCRVDGGERLEADGLFGHIATCFHLDSGAASGNLLEGLKGQLEVVQEQHLPILLIDDAQALSDDALEIVMHLAALEGEHGKLLRVLLFAEPQLSQRLAGDRFAGMPQPHRQELQPFDEGQVDAYLSRRLHAAGYTGPALFSERELKQLYRESGGLPGRLNDAAHQLLLGKIGHEKPRVEVRRYMQMGLAASAVIGTVLGLNDKINAILGGEPKAMTVSVPERPVVRLADEGNPWAVVIRNGESIQINCGAPGGSTVGVRPLMTAAVEINDGVPLSQPIMRDVSPLPEKVAEPAAPQNEEVHAEVAKPAEQKQTEVDAKTEADKPAVAEPAQQPVQIAANDIAAPPLVVKQEEPKPEKATTEKASQPADLALQEVDPSPVPASNQPERIILKGSGFMPDSKVAVSHGGKVEVLPPERVEYVDPEQMAISITPGMQPGNWAVQVSTPDNRRSNVLRFQVITAPMKPDEAQSAEPEGAPQMPMVEPEKAAEKAPVATAKPAQMEKPAKPEKTETKPAVAREKPAAAAVKKPSPPNGGVKGYDWYAAQPKSNFTLQLLASEKRANATAYAKQHKLKGPLGEFAMERNGKTLYALTQGSYPSRAEAKKAAAALPAGVKPWVRSMESVQQVMKRAQPVKAKPVSDGSADKPASTSERFKDTAWVWSQDPNHYTLQLSAASSEQAIEAEMRRISLPGELTVVQTLRDGKPWYALVYGSFASKEAARNTIERLPAALKQAGPWPRSFASLQDEISRSTPTQ